MYKTITLSSGRECLVDAEDFEWLSKNKWSDDSKGYAIRKARGKNTTEKMHRLIMNAKPNEQIDHINGMPWDNRKENLRIVENKLNSRNKGMYSTNKTGYKGVSAYGNKGKYTAQITVDGKKIHIGCFESVEEAAKAYNESAIHHFGEFAKLNEFLTYST
jgi:hypothetical protein